VFTQKCKDETYTVLILPRNAWIVMLREEEADMWPGRHHNEDLHEFSASGEEMGGARGGLLKAAGF
jgi:hypothetical protein